MIKSQVFEEEEAKDEIKQLKKKVKDKNSKIQKMKKHLEIQNALLAKI